ncbi:MAG: hypothetical protein ABSD88_00775 [Candidatus Korobacteraceae bacterium]|jgi:nitric oxide reductase subunit B
MHCIVRVPGDSLFALGALEPGWFVLGLVTGYSYDRHGTAHEGSLQQKQCSS